MSVSSCLSKGSQSAGQVESMQSIQNSAGANFGGANPQGLELAQNGMEQQQSMSFKKVKFILLKLSFPSENGYCKVFTRNFIRRESC